MSTLILVALLSDLLTPILIWKFGLPAEFRYIGHVAILGFIVMGFLRMLRKKNVPKAILIILAMSVLGISVALLNSQNMTATLWGWWLMFKFPLFGLFVYLQADWSEDFADRIRIWCIRLLWLEVGVQLLQYVMGEIPGDQLAGTFSSSLGSVHILALFELLVVALMFGDWIVRGKLKQLVVVIGLGIISSILSASQIFFFAVLAMGVLVIIIFLWRRHRLLQAVLFGFLISIALYVFPIIYNQVVPQAKANSFFSVILDESVRYKYFYSIIGFSSGSGYDVGRNYLLGYVWSQINHDTATRLFGLGLGALGISKAFGISGLGFIGGDLGYYSTGTSLTVVMGELGLIGLLVLTGFLLWGVVTLWKATAVESNQSMKCLEYGVLLFTLLWPIWLWYTTTWVMAVPMLFYWMCFGFVIRQSRHRVLLTNVIQPSISPHKSASTELIK